MALFSALVFSCSSGWLFSALPFALLVSVLSALKDFVPDLCHSLNMCS
jgi:hypothetical protein